MNPWHLPWDCLVIHRIQTGLQVFSILVTPFNLFSPEKPRVLVLFWFPPLTSLTPEIIHRTYPSSSFNSLLELKVVTSSRHEWLKVTTGCMHLRSVGNQTVTLYRGASYAWFLLQMTLPSEPSESAWHQLYSLCSYTHLTPFLYLRSYISWELGNANFLPGKGGKGK